MAKKKATKKKPRNSNKILKDLMKHEFHYQLPNLAFHPDLNRRRITFIAFVEKVKNVLQVVPELSRVLRHFPQGGVGLAKTKSANKAFYMFLEAKVEPQLLAALQQFTQDNKGHLNGVSAFKHLQYICSSQDAEEQQTAKQKFPIFLTTSNLLIIQRYKIIGGHRLSY